MSHQVKSLFLLLAIFVSVANADQGVVKLQAKGDKVLVTINGEAFADYQTSKSYPKPFFLPVRSKGGVVITRPLENPEDHKHHKGIFIAVDEVNGCKHWAERERINNVKVELVKATGNPAKMKVINHWLDGDGKPAVVETTEISIHANRLMAYDIQFTPAGDSATFDDTKEGLFGIRFINGLREREGGEKSVVVNAEGLKGSSACWGKPSNWIDYTGPVNDEIHGAAIFDHPENPRASRYHVRNYGLFTINPFGEKAYAKGEPKPLKLLKGQTFRLRYGLYVHPGDAKSAKVAEVYKDWVKGS